MEVDVNPPPPVAPLVQRGQSSRGRRWAVSLQGRAPRPAACKGCGETFEDGDLRVSLWSQRARGQFFHIACCRDACPADSFEALGSTPTTHVDEVRASIAERSPATVDVDMAGLGPDLQQPLENAWANQCLS